MFKSFKTCNYQKDVPYISQLLIQFSYFQYNYHFFDKFNFSFRGPYCNHISNLGLKLKIKNNNCLRNSKVCL